MSTLRIQIGAKVVLDGEISTVQIISQHPAGAYVHFDNRPGMSLKRLVELV